MFCLHGGFLSGQEKSKIFDILNRIKIRDDLDDFLNSALLLHLGQGQGSEFIVDLFVAKWVLAAPLRVIHFTFVDLPVLGVNLNVRREFFRVEFMQLGIGDNFYLFQCFLNDRLIDRLQVKCLEPSISLRGTYGHTIGDAETGGHHVLGFVV